MSEKKFRVLLAESAPGEAVESLRALYPETDCNLERLLAGIQKHGNGSTFGTISAKAV